MCPQVLVPQSVDRTLGQARDAGHLWDGAPFGDEQHGLAATKESNIVSVAQGARQALAVAPRETKLRRVGWPSHEISISQRAILPEIIGYSLRLRRALAFRCLAAGQKQDSPRPQ